METNGRFRDVPEVRVVRLAWGLCDARGREREGTFDDVVYPDGFEIPAEATRIHGITTARARAEGRPLGEVLALVVAVLPAVRGLVAHGLLGFDWPVVGGAIERAGLVNAVPDHDVEMEDTARLMWDLYPNADSRLPGAHLAVLGRPMPARVDGFHAAADDVRACAALFFALRNRRRHRRARNARRPPA